MLIDVLRLQLDFLGARAELAAGMVGSAWLRAVTPDGEGNRPVITIPGFLQSGSTLLRLNRYLNNNGFEAESWGLGRNIGPQGKSWSDELDRVERLLGDRIRALADEHSAPVALVGQSLGGVYARELALTMPDEIDRVIMLGSPALHPYVNEHHNRVIASMGYWVNRQSHAEIAGRGGLLHWDTDHPPLPCVSIHSPFDGVVDEASSVIPHYIVQQSETAAPRENLRVFSSHIGMGVNPWVLLAVADRLVQSKDHWRRFNPRRYFPPNLHWLVPLLYPPAGKIQQHKDITALAET